MLNTYQRDPEEFLRFAEVLHHADWNEAKRLLLWRKPRQGQLYSEMATALGVDTKNRYSIHIANDIWMFLQGGIPDGPYIPEPDVPPAIVKPCDGCGGIGDSPKFLRWAKVEKGEPVTFSYDSRNRPPSLAWLTSKVIMEKWIAPWEVDTSIRFKLVEMEKGDVHIKFEPIDGPGGTRGFAWLPNQSIEFMESGGDLSGDIVIDAIDRWSSRDETNETGEHEIGHGGLGLPHTDHIDDVMYPYSRGRQRPHSINDKRAKTARYPLRAIAA